MRQGVSVILSVVTRKDGSNSSPKGIGDVTSRLQVRSGAAECVVFEADARRVAPRGRLVGRHLPRRLYLDAAAFGSGRAAVGLVGRTGAGRALELGAAAGGVSACSRDAVGRELSGLHQVAHALDRDLDPVLAGGLARTDEARVVRPLVRVGLRDVRRGWQPLRTAADAVARSGLFADPPEEGGEEEIVVPTLQTLSESEFAAVVADDDVACWHGLAVGLAARSVREQRTGASLGDAVVLAAGSLDHGGCGLRGLRILENYSRQRPEFSDPRGIERAAAETIGVCPRSERHGLSLAGPRSGPSP